MLAQIMQGLRIGRKGVRYAVIYFSRNKSKSLPGPTKRSKSPDPTKNIKETDPAKKPDNNKSLFGRGKK